MYLLVMLMKVPQIVAECSITVLIYYIVRKETDLRMGILASLLFMINPFTFFLTAVWGAPESLVAVFALASIYSTYKGRHILAALLLGASLMAKPYTIVFLIPIILFAYPDLRFPKTLFLLLVTSLSAFLMSSQFRDSFMEGGNMVFPELLGDRQIYMQYFRLSILSCSIN